MQFSVKTKTLGMLLLMTVVTCQLAFAKVNTNENRLIDLRNQMEKAGITTAEKAAILKQIGQTGTFTAMAYAAQYLNDAKLKAVAAASVAEIATKHVEYNGANTRQWLAQARKLVSGDLKKRVDAYLMIMPAAEQGYVSLFNGKDLSGWKGLVENPVRRAKMSAEELAQRQIKADENMRRDWKVVDGLLAFVGTGYDNICTVKQYGDFEMLVDWRLDPAGAEPDAGIYLRGTPQVQMWDTARVDVGAQVGSGGLYNNQKYESKPSMVADNATGEWNSFYIKMVGDRVTVILNGAKVVDNVVLENYWDRKQPIFPVEQLELQAHGSKVYYRDIYVREL